MPASPVAGPSSSPPTFRSSTAAKRRSSHGPFDAPASPAASPFASFAGSYEQSLLAGRMSTLPSKPLAFTAEIGVIGAAAKGKGKAVKIPAHVSLGFEAFYYDLPSAAIGGGGARSRTPYCGTLDLEQHYIDLLLERSSADGGDGAAAPRFPGYRLPSARGQIQIMIRHPDRVPVKLFLVPYDLSGMGAGEKTFVRQKSYEDGGAGDHPTSSLRYAVHLQFCAPPATAADGEPRFYLHHSVRVVFAPRAPDAKDRLRVVHEGPAGAIGDAAAPRGSPQFSRFSGPSDEWDRARRWAKERRSSLSALSQPVVGSPLATDDALDMGGVGASFDPDGADWVEPTSPPARPAALSIPLSTTSLAEPTLAIASPDFIPPTSPIAELSALALSRPSSRQGRSTPPPAMPLR